MRIQDLIESSRRRDEAATKGPWDTLGEEGEVHAVNLSDNGGDPFHVVENARAEDAEFISASRTSEPLFREIAAVAVEALGNITEDLGELDEGTVSALQGAARQTLSKIQSLIDEAEKKK